MKELQHLFDNNRRWAERIRAQDPDFFPRLSRQQKPEYLWIGCSDSRVPANEIIDLPPGTVFVHRNIANMVYPADLNVLSVLQYAVEVLQVKHVIVCGHYGCGGVQAALEDTDHGLIDHWLQGIRNIYRSRAEEFRHLREEKERVNRLCELNVLSQVANVVNTTIVQNAWKAGQKLAVHGWIYDLNNGILQDLRVDIASPEEIPPPYGE